MQNKGKLIVFEGIDHVGKSTICEEVYNQLRQENIACSKYSFPGKTDGTLGKLVYDIHHDKAGIKAGNTEINSNNIDPLSMQILHIAAHIDILNKNIIPDVKTGKIVLLDRSWWSTIAYGVANGLAKVVLYDIIQPELRILRQLSKSIIIYISRKERENDFTKEKTTIILKTYKELCANNRENIFRIENDKEIKTAVQAACKAISKI